MILEVTPYLSADMCGPIDVVLTHPPEGRLKNTFTAARKFSTIHCNGELYVVEGQVYCDVIEMQFVSAKSESITPSNIPWKTNNNKKIQSTTENRIAAVHQSIQIQQQTATIKKESTQTPTKVTEIARSAIKRKKDQQTKTDATTTNKEPIAKRTKTRKTT